MKTYCFKLYDSKRNRKLHSQINAAGLVYNHCIALHKRYYRLFGKSLNIYRLQKHLSKLKKISRFTYLKEIGSQAVQDITQRIDKAYKLFFRNLKHKIRTAPPAAHCPSGSDACRPPSGHFPRIPGRLSSCHHRGAHSPPHTFSAWSG